MQNLKLLWVISNKRLLQVTSFTTAFCFLCAVSFNLFLVGKSAETKTGLYVLGGRNTPHV